MRTRPRRVLDLFCGAGAASYGYYLAGCEVTGVDIEYQPRYPFKFIRADALTFPLDGYDLIHASPPCQGYTKVMRHLVTKEYPLLIEPIRERLTTSGTPYVIENVPGAPMIDPLLLCGTMFGLKLWRHRLFETSFPVKPPRECDHSIASFNPYNAAARQRFAEESGGMNGEAVFREIMGVPWMTSTSGGGQATEAIPPAFTRHIGESGGIRQCCTCGRWWSPKRSHAKTCSPACRKALSRS